MKPTIIVPRTGEVPRSCPVALVVRHAERPAIPDGEWGHDLSLTRRGYEEALGLGTKLSGSVRSIRTSPVRRCVETAAAIREGSSYGEAAKPDTMLGDPGAFVVAPDLAGATLRQLGLPRVLRALANGDAPPGFADPTLAAHALATHVLDCAAGAGDGIHIFVTHDAVLAPFVARLTGVVSVLQAWPDYLDGAALWRDRARICVRSCGVLRVVAMPEQIEPCQQ